LSLYTGAKAYDDVFSRCLTEECKNTTIDVVSSRPCLVSTAGTNNAKDFIACGVESCVLGTLRALGKISYTEGSFYHVVQSWIIILLGETLTRRFGDSTVDGVEKKKEV
jgi:hypothetical protein